MFEPNNLLASSSDKMNHEGQTVPEDNLFADLQAAESGPLIFDAAVLREVTDAAGIAPEDLLEVFLNDAEQSLKRIAEALAKGDATLANRLSHSIKSSAANVGAMRLSAAARALEEASKSGLGAEAAARLDALATEVVVFRQAATGPAGMR